jgi:hypothetical protein
MKDTSTGHKKIKLRNALIGGVIIVIALFVSLSGIVYGLPRNAVAMRLRDLLPFPLIVINRTHIISFADADDNLKSIQRFYESQSENLSKAGLRVDFSTPEGKRRLMIREKELLNKLSEDTAIKILAEERGIAVSSDDVTRAVNQKMGALGNDTEGASQRLMSLYGWSIDDFKQKVVQPEMYRDLLAQQYSQNIDIAGVANQRIDDAKKALQKGSSFDDVAKQYSQGSSALQGGELGWLPVSDVVPEVGRAIKNQKIKQASDVIESSLGFHIVIVEEKKQINGVDMLRLKQIFTHKISFADWLTSEMKKMSFSVWSKEYQWQDDTARIDFRDPIMKAFEKETLQKSQGDASLLFEGD